MPVAARRARAARCAWAALALGAVGAATTAATTATGGATDLDALMALLTQRHEGVADFEQTQYLALLKQPLRSSGTLYYEAPDHLEQRTLEPHPQSAILDHDRLTLVRRGHQRSIRLQDYPQLAPLIECMRATLAGDRAALERQFRLEFSGDLAHWRLELQPLDPALAARVQRIRLEGARDAILQVEVRQSDGDRSVMTLKPRP
jgi:hypothetical protein